MSTTSQRPMAELITKMEKGRDSHVHWADYLGEVDGSTPCGRTLDECAGNRAEHLEWVAAYNEVLIILRGLDAHKQLVRAARNALPLLRDAEHSGLPSCRAAASKALVNNDQHAAGCVLQHLIAAIEALEASGDTLSGRGVVVTTNPSIPIPEAAIEAAAAVVEERFRLFFKTVAEAFGEYSPYLDDDTIRRIVRGEKGLVQTVLQTALPHVVEGLTEQLNRAMDALREVERFAREDCPRDQMHGPHHVEAPTEPWESFYAIAREALRALEAPSE